MSQSPQLPLSGPSFGAGSDTSFLSLVMREAPESLPSALMAGAAALPADITATLGLAHGTTVLGLRFADGVIVAGDRRATAGYTVADDRMRKVFAADDYSAIAIAGAAGQAIELVKMFQLELEHYEKLTGDRLSLEGKANRLAQMIRSNLPMAMQGLVVVPLFGGFDTRANEGRLFYYDPTGGRWEERDYQCTGSGGQPAKNSLKKQWRAGMDRASAIRTAVEALLDASEDDVATGGPNLNRGILPNVLAVTGDGATDVDSDDVEAAVSAVLESRRDRARENGQSR